MQLDPLSIWKLQRRPDCTLSLALCSFFTPELPYKLACWGRFSACCALEPAKRIPQIPPRALELLPHTQPLHLLYLSAHSSRIDLLPHRSPFLSSPPFTFLPLLPFPFPSLLTSSHLAASRLLVTLSSFPSLLFSSLLFVCLGLGLFCYLCLFLRLDLAVTARSSRLLVLLGFFSSPPSHHRPQWSPSSSPLLRSLRCSSSVPLL